jgi:hypothetical protein
MNAAIPYDAGNAIIVSSPTQSLVICIDKDYAADSVDPRPARGL